jgi:hypothetical protein
MESHDDVDCTIERDRSDNATVVPNRADTEQDRNLNARDQASAFTLSAPLHVSFS